jgi:hypothetical protein
MSIPIEDDPLYEIARTWWKDVHGGLLLNKDYHITNLALLLRQTQNDAIMACASVAQQQFIDTTEDFIIQKNIICRILAMKR